MLSNDFLSSSDMVEVKGGGQCTRETLPSAWLPLGCGAYPFLGTVAGKESEILWKEGVPVPLPSGKCHVTSSGNPLPSATVTVSLLIQVGSQLSWLMLALGAWAHEPGWWPMDWECGRVVNCESSPMH